MRHAGLAGAEKIGQMLTSEMVRILLREYLGVEFGPEEIERLRPLIERQMERMRELHAVDVGGDDPQTTVYIQDLRLFPDPWPAASELSSPPRDPPTGLATS